MEILKDFSEMFYMFMTPTSAIVAFILSFLATNNHKNKMQNLIRIILIITMTLFLLFKKSYVFGILLFFFIIYYFRKGDYND